MFKVNVGEKRDFFALCCHLDTLKGGFNRNRSGSTKRRERAEGDIAHVHRHRAFAHVVPEMADTAHRRAKGGAGRRRADNLAHPPLGHSLIGNKRHGLGRGFLLRQADADRGQLAEHRALFHFEIEHGRELDFRELHQ